MQSLFQLVIHGKSFPIPSNFYHFSSVDPSIIKSLLTNHYYEIQSDVDESSFESFVNWWVNQEAPNLCPENIQNFDKLTKEFNWMIDPIQSYISMMSDSENEDNNEDKFKIVINDFSFALNVNDKTACLIECNSQNDVVFVPRSFEYDSQEFIITNIGKCAFRDLRYIKNVQFAEDSEIREIGSFAFANSSLESIVIPSHVKVINKGAFFGCRKLKKFELPRDSELEKMGKQVFFDSAVETMNIPSSFIDFNGGFCKKTPYLKNLSISLFNMGLSYLDNKFVIGQSDLGENFAVLLFARRDLVKAIIPSFINQIAPFAFDECKQLKSVIFADDSELQVIDQNAFNNTLIESISIPSHVKKIGKHAFSNCKKLAKVSFTDDSELEIIDKEAFSSTAIEEIIIPPHVKAIGEYAFTYCNQLKKVLFDSNSELEFIGDYSFSSSAIEDIVIPPHVKVVAKDAFSYCNQLKKVDFSMNSEIQIIGTYAFFKSSIETLIIPSSIVELQKRWCSKTKGLFNITIEPKEVQNIVLFDNALMLGKSNVNEDVYDVLICARRDIERAVIPPFVKKIASHAFNNCKKLQTVIFAENSQLLDIDEYAFAKSSIRDISIPSQVTYIGEYSFSNCNQLINIEIPKDSQLRFIDDSAFCGCPFRHFFIPSFVDRIGENAFSECSNLEDLYITEDSNLNYIDMKAFYRTAIKKISLPQKVSFIGKNAFSICDNLQYIELPENSEYRTITNQQFNCSSIESIKIPANVEKIDEGWCKNASNLKYFFINPNNRYLANYQNDFILGKSNPESDVFDIIIFARRDIEYCLIPHFIRQIGPFALYKCFLLKKVEFAENSELEFIGNRAFSKTSLEKIYFPSTLRVIDENAFAQSENLESIAFPDNSELQSIDKYAFDGVPIKRIIIPPELKNLLQLNF